ncbi:MAG: outer membrane beta-barrel family protein [Mucilaginibacter sp.]
MFSKALTGLLLMGCLSAAAQVKLNGRLADSEQKPVSFATVLLLTKDSVFYKNDLTANDGTFAITAQPGDYILKVTMLGQSLFRRQLHLNADMNLGDVKVNTVNQLNGITVKGQKPIIQQDMDKLIFNVANSPLKKGYTGLDVLARTPRLQVNADGVILLRNKTPSIYVNGRQMRLSGQDLVSYLSGLNAEMIQSIEVQTTGTAETDATANGGVVNILLKKPAKGFTSNLTTSYTYRKGNTWSDYGGLNANYGSDKWNFYSKLSDGKDNDYGTYATAKNFFTNNGINLANGSFKGDKRNINLLGGIVFYPDKKNEFGAEFYYNNGKGVYTTNERLNVYDPQLSSISNNHRVEGFTNKVWYGTLNYTYKLDSLGSTLKFIGDAGHNQNLSDNSTNTDYSFGSYPSSLTRYHINPVSDYYTFQGDLSKKYRKGILLRAGLKFSSVDRNNILVTSIYENPDWVLTSDGQENFTNRENVSAAYAILSGKVGAKSSFRAGLRTEYTDITGEDKISGRVVSQHYIDFFPRFYYGYAAGTGKTLSFSFFRSIQRPSFRDLNPFITKENDYSYIEGNPDLKPQFTNSIDISYQWGKQSLSFYANHTDNLIAGVYSNTGNITYYKPMNFGRQAQYGIDYNYYSDITKWLYTNASLGAYYYTFENGELHPSQYSFNSNIYARFKLAKTWSADLLNVFNSKFQNYVISAAPQYRLDLSLQKDVLAGKGLLKFACSDVFNTQHDKSLSTYTDFTLDFYQKRRTQSFTLMFVYNISAGTKIKNKSVDSNNDVRGRL